MTADQPRDWDRELNAIDKVIAKQGTGGAGPGGVPGGTAPVPAPAPPRPGVAPPPPGRRRSVALTWFWTLLAVALAVALPLWPYQKECGARLFFFLGAAGVTVIAGLVGALESWANRRGFAHLLCLLVLLWAGVVGASEALPRSGYARETKPWLCPAAPAAPAPTRAAPAPGTAPRPEPGTTPAPQTTPQPEPEASPPAEEQPTPGAL